MQEKGGPSPIPPKVSDFEKVTKNICNITFQIQGAGWVQPNLENLKNLWNLLVVHKMKIKSLFASLILEKLTSSPRILLKMLRSLRSLTANVTTQFPPTWKCDHPVSLKLKMWPPSFTQPENVTTQFLSSWKCDHLISPNLKDQTQTVWQGLLSPKNPLDKKDRRFAYDFPWNTH